MTPAQTDSVSLRDIGPDDEALFFDLFCAVRAQELGMGAFEPQLQHQLLQMQFNAQHLAYREQFPHARAQLVMRDGAAVGWVIVDRSEAAVHCIDLAVVSLHRRAGIGIGIVRVLIEEATAANRPLLATITRMNSAARGICDRLGFRIVGETDVHLAMEWRRVGDDDVRS